MMINGGEDQRAIDRSPQNWAREKCSSEDTGGGGVESADAAHLPFFR